MMRRSLYCTGMAAMARRRRRGDAQSFLFFACHAQWMYVAAAKLAQRTDGGGRREVSARTPQGLKGARVREGAKQSSRPLCMRWQMATRACNTYRYRVRECLACARKLSAGLGGRRLSWVVCMHSSGMSITIHDLLIVMVHCRSSSFISVVYVDTRRAARRAGKARMQMLRAHLDHIWMQIDRFTTTNNQQRMKISK